MIKFCKSEKCRELCKRSFHKGSRQVCLHGTITDQLISQSLTEHKRFNVTHVKASKLFFVK